MAGNPRQSSGAWDSGVYKFGSTSSADTTAAYCFHHISCQWRNHLRHHHRLLQCLRQRRSCHVQLQIDGANVGSADTSAPFSFALDTTSYPNGSHTLKAMRATPLVIKHQRFRHGQHLKFYRRLRLFDRLCHASIPTAVLNGTNGAFTFTRTGSTTSPLNVNYNLVARL